jgi:UDP-3-O-[3-hydroxymyristoyl] glucosamine N-acyltransferase
VEGEGPNLLVTPNPYLAFARVIDLFFPPPEPEAPGISPAAIVDPAAEVSERATVHPGATIGPRAKVGPGCVVHPGAYVGADAVVGADSVLHANVVLYPETEIGERVILHAGAVIGSDGFGFAPDGGENVKIRQVGRAVIEDDVEVGANCTVDRAVLGETRIGRGTKIDNLVQIGHNVRIGERCLIVAQVGISGSSTVGNAVRLGGQVGVGGHIHIGDGAEVGAKSGVVDVIGPGAKVLGLPAIPLSDAKKSMLAVRQLPQMRKELRALRKTVEALQARLGDDNDGR